MIQREGCGTIGSFISTAICLTALLGLGACSGSGEKARLAVEEYLKNQGAQEVKLDRFYTNSAFPNRAYVSVTVTYNFANSSGQPQKEFLGYILRQEGPEWKVDQNTSYTTEEQRAMDLLAGRKK